MSRFAVAIAIFAAAAFAAVWGLVLPAAAAPISVDKTVVYIECHDPADATKFVRGTGVVVNKNGTVLTAGHVAPANWTCSGSIGSAQPGTLTAMVRNPSTSSVDAALFRFSAGAPYQAVGLCELQDWMVGQPITVAGFPHKTQTGVISFRQGVLSTILMDPKGVLETDTQTIAGMSGGPVFSKNLAGIVGIVVGAEFDPTGEVSYYGILSAEQIAQDLHLNKADKACFHESRVIDLPDVDIKQSGATKVAIGVSPDEAACFINGIHGFLNDENDLVKVAVEDDGRYYVEGENRSGGPFSVDVRCLWYD